MLRGENMRFRPVFAQFFFKRHKNGNIPKLKAWSSECKRMISVDYIMNALEHSKVRLPFFDTHCRKDGSETH